MEQVVTDASKDVPVSIEEIARLSDEQCQQLAEKLNYLLDKPAE